MSVALPDLPYSKNALAPHISEKTLEFHYGKHHKAYVNKLNGQIQGTEWEKADLEEIIKSSEGKNQGVFNNAAQVWNHTFYWNSLSPDGGGAPLGAAARAIEKDFGSFEKFKARFAEAALGQFGSGWAWLVEEGGSLKIVTSPNAETPLTSLHQKPLLTCDVWEHAYYIDYQNARNKYIEAFWSLINWSFANKNLANKNLGK